MQAAVFEPSQCQNQWCNNKGNIPSSGLSPKVAQCGDLATMIHQRNTTGGITGRGVTPCPFGYLQKHPWVGSGEVSFLLPYQGQVFNKMSQSSIFFDPDRPTFLPPQGQPRSLTRIGYEWRS